VVRARKYLLCKGRWACLGSIVTCTERHVASEEYDENRRPLVTADGTGIVSHAGAALLRELADESGLTQGWTAALLDTYKGAPVHLPGRVLTDLAVTLADGGDCLADLAALRDQAVRSGRFAPDRLSGAGPGRDSAAHCLARGPCRRPREGLGCRWRTGPLTTP